MEKVLGLDLGTNSIGATLREGSSFPWYGVSVFKKGVGEGKTGEYSFAAERTSHRATRRLYNARRYRKWETLRVLIENGFCPLKPEELKVWKSYTKGVGRVFPMENEAFRNWIKLDFDGDGKPDYSSPYQLRRQLIEETLDLTTESNRFKIGRAIYHLAQRRGFKSSRKDNESKSDLDNEDAGEQEKNSEATLKILSEWEELLIQHKTLGGCFAYLEDQKERVRNRNALRKHYEDELAWIANVQKIEPELTSQLSKAIFFQRPLRSQKGTIGKCSLESNKSRCPISHPNFEAFRAWQFINNIKYRKDEGEDWEQLPSELRKIIFEKKFHLLSNSTTFGAIRKEINSFFGKEYDLNYKRSADKVSISICPVSGRLKKVFGENWRNWEVKEAKVNKKGKTISYDIFDVWHALLTFEDEDYFREFCIVNWKLTESQSADLVTLWKRFPIGYANLSLKAINKILPFLEEGMIYTEAVLLAKIPEAIGLETFDNHREELVNSIRNEIKQNQLQKKVVQITNGLIAKYYLLPMQERFGFKDTNYALDNVDRTMVRNAVAAHFGEKNWATKSVEDQKTILDEVEREYQAFFADPKRRHRKQPHLLDQIKSFLKQNKLVNDPIKLEKLYHPSQIETYAPAQRSDDGKLYLDSPLKNEGAFKNPMAMKTLHELRHLLNHLIKTEKIDEDTRIVVEIAREMNDKNKRWAIEKYQRDRERENESFANAIEQLTQEPDFRGQANADSKKDNQKFRLWTEQLENLAEIEKEVSSIEKDKKISVSEKDIRKYRLWKEQGAVCMYTGRTIRITDLFDTNQVDFEHTIPRSKSFDNSLANQTVAYAKYNRDIKGTRLPKELPNYKMDTNEGTAIEPRLKAWRNKVSALEVQLANWKIKSKGALDKAQKDNAIRNRHLVEFELKYWRDKLDRFEREDVPAGFKNSQLVDTQIISKYALHYLKTVFKKVDVQKGSVTSEFRKIYGIQEKGSKKDRTKHYHHAIDAAVLTLIPPAAKREEILKKAYEYEEKCAGKQYKELPFEGFKYETIEQIKNEILINNRPSKDQVLTPAKKHVRKRGKQVYLKDRKGDFILDERGVRKEKFASGSSIRGQLHKETFYGQIKIAKKENGSLIRNEDGKIVFNQINGKDEFWAVIRVQVTDSKFNPKNIVDDSLRDYVLKQLESKTPNDLIDFRGKKIRHIRCRVNSGRGFMNPENLTKVKRQTYLSDKEYKNFYYADSGANYLFGLYETSKGKREVKAVNVFSAAKINSLKPVRSKEELFEPNLCIGAKKEIAKLIHVFQEGQKVIFFFESKEELKELPLGELSKRLYFVRRLHQATIGNIQFQHHLEARTDEELVKAFPKDKFKSAGKDGFSKFQKDFIAPRLLFKPIRDEFIMEERDFLFQMDGSINFLF
jgi:CRISPR-associated endonuclease Csn1